MNSNLLNSFPQYIFQNEHERLESVNKIIEEQKKNDDESRLETASCEVSEYPIEFYQNQQHIIDKYMSNK
jgi:hypothetical protein